MGRETKRSEKEKLFKTEHSREKVPAGLSSLASADYETSGPAGQSKTMNDDPHRICRNEKDIAVLEERGKATAMALVLAEKLAAADKKLIFAMLFGIMGWTLLIALALHK